MSAASTNIKIDPVVKQQVIPSRIGDPFYSPANIAYLETVTGEIDAGKAKLVEHELLDEYIR